MSVMPEINLDGVDGRTRLGRARRDLERGLLSDMGIADAADLSTAQRATLDMAVSLLLQAQVLGEKIASGTPVPADGHQRILGRAMKALKLLGVRLKPDRPLPGSSQLRKPGPPGETIATYCLRVHGTLCDQWRQNYDTALVEIDAEGPLSEQDANYRQQLQARRDALGDRYDDAKRDLRRGPVRRQLIEPTDADCTPIRRRSLVEPPPRPIRHRQSQE